MHRGLTAALLTFFVLATAGADDPPGPSKAVPELTVLDHYVGDWDVAVKSGGGPFVNGRARGKWILDGRFLEQTGTLSSEDGGVAVKVTTLMTYNTDDGSYQSWTFISNGATSHMKGRWDAARKVMITTRVEGDVTTTTTANFSEEGVERWSIVSKRDDNEVVAEMSGINTKRKS